MSIFNKILDILSTGKPNTKSAYRRTKEDRIRREKKSKRTWIKASKYKKKTGRSPLSNKRRR